MFLRSGVRFTESTVGLDLSPETRKNLHFVRTMLDCVGVPGLDGPVLPATTPLVHEEQWFDWWDRQKHGVEAGPTGFEG